MLLAGLALPVGVLAQTQISIPVTVSASRSEQQSVTLGSAAIAVGTMELIDLQRINRYIRLAEQQQQSAEQIATLRPFQVASLTPVSGSDSEVGADFARWDAFSNFDYRFGSHDGTINTPAHDFDRYGVLVGTDYRFNPGLVLGLSAGYKHSDNNFDSIAGHADANVYSLSAFGNWYPLGAWWVDGIVRGGIDDYDITRPVTGGNAHGDPNGSEISASLGTGYDFSRGALTVTPSLRLDYTNAAIDHYAERAPTDAVTYGHQTIRSFTTNLGGTASYAVNTSFGVLLPQLTFEWVNEFENDPRRIDAHPSAGGPTFFIPVDPRDSGFYRIAVGTTALLAHGWMLFVHYEAELAKAHRDVNTVTLGVRVEL